MYIPTHYKNENEAELIEFIGKNSFGLLVSKGAAFPSITHLPFTIEKDETIVLWSHFAAANPHAKELKTGDKVTVVFNGPHGYISPSLYDEKVNVPTWNYIAVHAIGTYQLCTPEEKNAGLEKMIASFEPAYAKQYESLPHDYLEQMKKGIVAFTIRVEQLQGKYKLSQNKTEGEIDRITSHLASSPETKELSDYMKRQ